MKMLQVGRMEYEVTLLNVGDAHLPADEKYMPSLYLLIWLGLMGYGAYSLVLLKKHHEETRSKVHLVVKYACAVALACIFGRLFISAVC